jgi:hypothetical protein
VISGYRIWRVLSPTIQIRTRKKKRIRYTSNFKLSGKLSNFKIYNRLTAHATCKIGSMAINHNKENIYQYEKTNFNLDCNLRMKIITDSEILLNHKFSFISIMAVLAHQLFSLDQLEMPFTE